MPPKIVDSINLGEVVALHGTSIEAAFPLFRTGRLVPGFFSNPLDDYLHFIPVKRNFEGHELCGDLADKQDDEVMYNSVWWAGNIAGRHAIQYETGHYVIDSDNIGGFHLNPIARPAISNGLASREYGNLPQDVKEDIDFVVDGLLAEGLSLERIQEILKISLMRGGVVLGIGKELLELPLELDDTAEFGRFFVRARLPQGLDARFVKYVMPVGEVEKELLSPYM